MKTKEQVVEELKGLLYRNNQVIAAWEGGAAATGYDDKYSDLDLSVICEDDAVETIFPLLDKHLGNELGVIRKLRMPEPTWHGFSQCFYQVKNVPEFFYLDILVIKKSSPSKLTESDRHGNARVWFEKEKVLDNTPTPADEILKKGRNFFKLATQSDFLQIIEINKNIARRNFVETYPMFYQFVFRQLGTMLNLKYRPNKVDFGLRYCSRDYPVEKVELIESCFRVGSIEELAKKFGEIESIYQQLKKEMGAKYGSTNGKEGALD